MDSVISSDLLTADLSLLLARALPEPLPRIVRTDDLKPLTRLHLINYPPGIGARSHVETISEITATFEDDCGVLRPGASLVAEADGRPAGAVLTVERSIWDGGLEGPFIIDLFIDPQPRGRGIGRALMTDAILAYRNAGNTQLSLRVGEGTSGAAHRPYGSLGFRRAGSPASRKRP